MVLIFPLAVADLTVADRPDRENEHPAKAGRLEDCVKRDLECSLNSIPAPGRTAASRKQMFKTKE